MKKASVYFILIALLFAAGFANANPVCEICRKSVNGSYIRFDDGSVYCIDCRNNYPACKVCGKPSRNAIEAGGESFCRDCFAHIDKCQNCGNPLSRGSVVYPDLQLKLCAACERALEKCDLCGKPSKNLKKSGDKQLCGDCLGAVDICFACNNPIIGKISWFDGDNSRKYCQNCVNKYPACSGCGAPAADYSLRLDDGRVLCRACRRDAYFDPLKVKAIKKDILDYLSRDLNMTIRNDIKYELQGRDYIQRLGEGLSEDMNGLFYRQNDRFEIYVLYGLRKKDLYQVIAHEVAHAWSSDNNSPNLTLQQQEGFAQWTAYHTLGRFGYGQYRETLKEGDSIYANGLKEMLALEKRGGKQAVFDYLKNR